MMDLKIFMVQSVFILQADAAKIMITLKNLLPLLLNS